LSALGRSLWLLVVELADQVAGRPPGIPLLGHVKGIAIHHARFIQ